MTKKKPHWIWERANGLSDLLACIKESGNPTPSSKLRNYDVEDDLQENMFSRSWGERVRDATDMVVFENGNVLVCATIASFGGTFQSYDNISVNWFYGKVKR